MGFEEAMLPPHALELWSVVAGQGQSGAQPSWMDALLHHSGLVRSATSMCCHTLLQVETLAGKLALVGAGAWLSLRANQELGR